MTTKRYLHENDLQGKVVITEIHAGENPFIRVSETWFHPQGGGQKADRGTIGTAQVIHVGHNGSEVDHYVNSVSGFEVGQIYSFTIDKSWRQMNAAYHTAGHLIASIVEQQNTDFVAISGHQWPGEARVEFQSNSESAVIPRIETLTKSIQEALSASLSVTVHGDPYRSREINIGDYKGIPCGGTHVSELNQISDIRLKEIKLKKGKLRISYESFPRLV